MISPLGGRPGSSTMTALHPARSRCALASAAYFAPASSLSGRMTTGRPAMCLPKSARQSRNDVAVKPQDASRSERKRGLGSSRQRFRGQTVKIIRASGPVQDIALGGQARKLDDDGIASGPLEVRLGISRVFRACLVIVGQDDDGTARNVLAEVGPPIAQ